MICHDALSAAALSQGAPRCACGAIYHAECAPRACGTLGCGTRLVAGAPEPRSRALGWALGVAIFVAVALALGYYEGATSVLGALGMGTLMIFGIALEGGAELLCFAPAGGPTPPAKGLSL